MARGLSTSVGFDRSVLPVLEDAGAARTASLLRSCALSVLTEYHLARWLSLLVFHGGGRGLLELLLVVGAADLRLGAHLLEDADLGAVGGGCACGRVVRVAPGRRHAAVHHDLVGVVLRQTTLLLQHRV